MIDDPYKELGIDRSASPDDIKKAYRRKAKEYHPDLHPNDPTATEKMNRINEAYDMLTHPEKYQARQQQQAQQEAYRQAYQNPFQGYSQGGYSQSGYGQDGYYDPFAEMFGFGTRQSYGSFGVHEEAGDPPLFRMAVNDLNAKQYQAAVTHLAQVVSTSRNARWYYLSALAERGISNTVRATDYAQRAVQMEPNNQQYHALLNDLRMGAQRYEQQAANHGFNMNFNPSSICTTLCLINLCCGSYRGCGFPLFFCC